MTTPEHEPVRHRGLITMCVIFGTTIQALDSTISNLALPYMQGSLNATIDQVAWVITSYIIATAIMTALVWQLGPVSSARALDLGARGLGGAAIAAVCLWMFDRDLRRRTLLRTR